MSKTDYDVKKGIHSRHEDDMESSPSSEWVLYLFEFELQAGTIVWQCEREKSLFFATVTTDPNSGWVQVKIPGFLISKGEK